MIEQAIPAPLDGQATTSLVRARLIHNPHSGRPHVHANLTRVIELLQTQGWSVERCETTGPGDATKLAAQAVATGYQVVIAAGGDGTINEIVQALAGTQTALGVVPVGTVNVWAREMGITFSATSVASVLINGHRRTIDLGRAGHRYFLMMASVGFDADVARNVTSPLKKRWGPLAYILSALQLARQYAAPRARIVADGRIINGRLLMLVIGNTRLYGGQLRITAQALADDGLLDLCLFLGSDTWMLLRHGWHVLWRRHATAPRVMYLRAHRIRVTAERKLPAQVDGEVIGDTPLTFEIVPHALHVIVPPDTDSRIFATQLPMSPLEGDR